MGRSLKKIINSVVIVFFLFILSGKCSPALALEGNYFAFNYPAFNFHYTIFSTLSLYNPSFWLSFSQPLPFQLDSSITDSTMKDTSDVSNLKDTSKVTTLKDTSDVSNLKDTSKVTMLKDTNDVSNLKDTSKKETTYSKTTPFERIDTLHPKTEIKNHPKGFSSYSTIDKEVDTLTTHFDIDKHDIGYSYNIGLDEYLKIRKKSIQNVLWDSLMARYSLAEALSGGDLARLISQSTGLTIPVPPNPIMGIFGKPTININVQGELNLTLGWRWDSQNLGAVSAFGQTQSTPIFNQDIRVNVSAKIGDKLKLTTDWNTHRQFDYDNKFKLGFEGDDDDIIKLVELGNVNLPLPTTLIRGGQTLFGVRSDFQFGPLFLKTIFSQRRGERKYVDVRGGTSRMPFQIRAYDYARNHFFLDTAYRSIYREYFKNSTGVIPSNGQAIRVK